MNPFKKRKIGFILTKGFRTADVIELDAIFRFHPRNQLFFVGEHIDFIEGSPRFNIQTNTTFDTCPQLDVLVIGELSAENLQSKQVLAFIKKQTPKALWVIGISNGVIALHNAGVLTNQFVTADRSSLSALRSTSLQVVTDKKRVIDGKFITAAPSTGAIEAGFIVFQKLRGNWLTKFSEFTLEYNPHVQYAPEVYTSSTAPALPRPLKIGIFSGPDLYIPDVMGATDVFSALPNAEFHYLSHEKGTSNSIIGFGPKMRSTTTLDESPQLDVIIFGASHPKYVKDKRLLDFLLKQEPGASAIISVCAGTFIVGSAGLLNGKHAATNYHQVPDLPRIGVVPTGDEIAVDGKFFSAGPAVGSYEVGLKAVERIIGKEWAAYIEKEHLEFSPSPVFGTTPESASKSILVVSKLLSFAIQRIFRPAIKKGYFARSLTS